MKKYLADRDLEPAVRSFCLKLCLVLMVLSVGAVVFLDAGLAAYLKAQFGSPVHLWARATTDVAKAGPYFAISISLWLSFLVVRKTQAVPSARAREVFLSWERWASFAFISFLVSGILVQFLKHLIGRRRPYADEALSSYVFHPFSSNYEHHSLPSGHSQVLFTAAMVLIVAFPRLRWVWFFLAALFASTRVITLNHWLSDILAGAAVGIMGTVLTLNLIKIRENRSASKKSTRSAVAALLVFAAMGLATVLGSAVLAPAVARADGPGPFGLGIVIGDPTGLSANYRLSGERSVDAALAWSFGNNPGFELHSDYLWRRPGLLRADAVKFDLHYGVGARLLSLNDRGRDNDRTLFGPRLPVGLGTNFNQRALEVFFEIALVLNVIPATSSDLDFGLGARIYF